GEGGGCGCGSGTCCGDHADGEKFGEALYAAEQRDELPGAALLASLGCGNPTAVADLQMGETVLDLGSGGGIDVILSARRVRPGGRLGVSDIVAEDRLSATERAERGSYVGCVAGALAKAEYEAGLAAAGFERITVEFTHEVADGMHGAIVRAVKTATPAAKGL